MKSIFILLILLLSFTSNCYAGDGVTIVLDTGVTLEMRQGYEQLSREFKKYNKSDYANKFVEMKSDGSNVAVNLSQIAVVCRDTCSNMKIEFPDDD